MLNKKLFDLRERMRGRVDALSTNERAFMLEALRNDGIRIDGRKSADIRKMTITFGKDTGHVEATMGRTRYESAYHADARCSCRYAVSVLCVVTAEIVEPREDRPTEGMLQFYTELSPMAAPDIRPGR